MREVSGSKLRRIILIGDSHMRTLGNGLIYRLSDVQSPEQSQFYVPNIHDFPAMSPIIEQKIEIVYCTMRNPDPETVRRCLKDVSHGEDDIAIVGSAAWPLSTHEAGRILEPDEYKAGVEAVGSALLKGFIGLSSGRSAYWMSSVAHPTNDCDYMGSIFDHRNDGLYSLMNDIARGVFKGTHVRYFDVFNISLAINNPPFDMSHYSLFVLSETVEALLTDVLTVQQL